MFNNSGEEYEDAQVRLVVGKINLVEKIAKLAQVSKDEVEKWDESKRDALRLKAARRSLSLAVPADATAPSASGGRTQRDHQGRPQRVLHLHDRRHGDDPQRLVEADVQFSRRRPCR